MKRVLALSVLGVLSGLLLWGGWPALAHDDVTVPGSAPHPQQTQPPQRHSPAQQYFGDVSLVNQYNETMRFYSDLLHAKVVVIHTFFATCEQSCPLVIATFAKLQEWLEERLGKEVHLLSITVDPETDTPARLKAYAERLKAKPGWYFLTGAKRDVEATLYKLGQYVEQKEDHSNIIIIGNATTGLWKKAFGLATPAEIRKLVESVLHDRG